MAELRKAVEGVGYGVGAGVSTEIAAAEPDTITRAAQRETINLRNKLVFAVSIGAYMLLITTSEFSGGWSWLPSFLSNKYLMLALATPVQFWAGGQFYRGMWGALKHKTANMNTLIASGTSAAYFYSLAAIIFPGFFTAGGREANVFFDTAVIIIALILLGRFLEARAKGQTSEAIKKLMGIKKEISSG